MVRKEFGCDRAKRRTGRDFRARHANLGFRDSSFEPSHL
jgi:hypothetical protein